jgi:predicted  nucleic acid-binding Zn-ribbon protein
MIPKRTLSSLTKRIEKLRDRIGKDRDALRELLDEAEALEESCRDVYESLDYSVQRLSEYA